MAGQLLSLSVSSLGVSVCAWMKCFDAMKYTRNILEGMEAQALSSVEHEGDKIIFPTERSRKQHGYPRAPRTPATWLRRMQDTHLQNLGLLNG